jgi:hypothetical protein
MTVGAEMGREDAEGLALNPCLWQVALLFPGLSSHSAEDCHCHSPTLAADIH